MPTNHESDYRVAAMPSHSPQSGSSGNRLQTKFRFHWHQTWPERPGTFPTDRFRRPLEDGVPLQLATKFEFQSSVLTLGVRLTKGFSSGRWYRGVKLIDLRLNRYYAHKPPSH